MPVNRGDIVLVALPDTSGKPRKTRPALVVSSDHNNQRLQDAIVAVITSTTVHARL
jgi:mRNA-degrading endonuclease toxin of MazEF toxin-antitoxin module